MLENEGGFQLTKISDEKRAEMDAFCEKCTVKAEVDCMREREGCSSCKEFYGCLPFCIGDVKYGRKKKRREEEK